MSFPYQVFALLFPFFLLFQDNGKPSQEFRVVFVKGKPLRSGKAELKDGQKITDPEKVMFTSMGDLVILLNADFEKIRMKPSSVSDLNRLHPIHQFRAQNKFFKVRGIENELEFQSFSDTLVLDLVLDLKKSADIDRNQLQFLDFFGESHPNALRIKGSKLWVATPKKGIFFLHFRHGTGRSEALATIEFLDKNEVNAELNYVKNLASHPDSVATKQIFFLKKTYPNMPENQIMAVLKTGQ